MALPIFSLQDDPGPNLIELLNKMGLTPSVQSWSSTLDVPHGTTCVAIKYSGGVVIAGDRRATRANYIANRDMEKVVQTDQFSAVAISGSVGPAVDMIKLFALQLEHYEKMDGRLLSLEGKANFLASMVKANLPAAMQGFVVDPLFAGFDTHDNAGRIWTYDATGARYEQNEFGVIGSGSTLAGTVIKVNWKSDLTVDDSITLACRALWEAADGDSATGGADMLRGIYPIVATVEADGWKKISDDRLQSIYNSFDEELKSR